ncbi:uncharacterized protein [Anabrus simplex]|uniref:uncharacterized protein n=1 Tax=Anabrus simplex TaxID=316456 RepID=UPI0035A3594F
MTHTKWGDEKTLKFIELYKEKEILWNQFHHLYKDKRERDKALGEIVSGMNIEGFNVVDAKRKIKTLRATYCGEVMKINRSEKACCGSKDVYVPVLKWYNKMREIMEKGTPRKDADDNVKTTPLNSRSEDEASEQISSIDIIKDDQSFDDDYEQTIPKSETLFLPTSIDLAEPPQKKFKGRSRIVEIASTVQELKGLKQSMLQTEDNECDIFAKHIAAQLKQLSPQQCIIAQGEIQTILTRCRLADLCRNQYDTNTSGISSYEASSSSQQFNL